MFASFSRSMATGVMIVLAAASANADDSVLEEVAVEATPVEVLFVSAAALESELDPERNFRQEVAAMVESDLLLELQARLADQRPAS